MAEIKGWSADNQKYNGVDVYVPRASDMVRKAVMTFKKDQNLPATVRIFNEDSSYKAYDIDLGLTAGDIAQDLDLLKMDRMLHEKAGELFYPEK